MVDLLNVPINRALSLSPWFLHHRTWCRGVVWSVCLSVKDLLSYCCPSSDSNIKDTFYDQGAGIPNTPRSVNIFSICKGSSEPCYFVLQIRGMTFPNRGGGGNLFMYYFIFFKKEGQANQTNVPFKFGISVY